VITHTEARRRKMKSIKLMLALACLIALAGSALAQNTPNKRTFGYIDGKTGIFHPLDRTLLSEETAAAITPTTGTFVFNVTITVSSALPTTAVIGCTVSGGVADLLTGEFSNFVGVTAKRTGNTATCTLHMPYEWYLGQPTKDVVELDLDVSASVGTIGSAGYYAEEFIAPIVTQAVPVNGTTTTKNVTTTI
jgi:hypothetical protein